MATKAVGAKNHHVFELACCPDQRLHFCFQHLLNHKALFVRILISSESNQYLSSKKRRILQYFVFLPYMSNILYQQYFVFLPYHVCFYNLIFATASSNNILAKGQKNHMKSQG